MSAVFIRKRWETCFWEVRVGRLLTGGVSAPWPSSHAGAGHASRQGFPKIGNFGGCSPLPVWEM